MIISFSPAFAKTTTNPGDPRYAMPLDLLVDHTVETISLANYRLTWKNDSPIGNVYCAITWARGRRVRFTLETRDAYEHGSRKAASGRHMRKASWEAHRDVMLALLKLDPDAVIRTALATYRGKTDFERQYPATAHANRGSIMNPVTIRSTTVRS